jgi:HK97 family phage major capsid protein
MSEELKKLQNEVDEATGALRTAVKEMNVKGAHISEIKVQLDSINEAMKKGDEENEKLMKRLAIADQHAESLKSAEERIKDLEIKAAKMSDFGMGKDMAIAEEIKSLKDFCVSGRVTDKKYMRSDSDTEGGFLMQEATDSEIIKPVTEISDVRPYARVKSRSALRTNMPVRATRAVMYMEGENVSPTQSNSTYAKRGIQLHRGVVYGYATLEALNYGEWDIESEITADQIEAKAEKEGSLFIEGTGSGQPYGLISRLVSDSRLYASGSASALTLDAVLKIPGEVKKSYNNAMYAFNNKTLYNIRTLADADGALGWQPGNLAAGVPNQLNGRNYAIFEDMDDVDTNTYPVFYGDVRRAYTICDGKEMIMQRIFNKEGGYDFLLYNWFGADVVLSEAGIVMKCATSV